MPLGRQKEKPANENGNEIPANAKGIALPTSVVDGTWKVEEPLFTALACDFRYRRFGSAIARGLRPAK
jgi:hypothetical protein